MNLDGEAGRPGKQVFRREVLARLETCMLSQTATDLVYALGQINLTFRILIFSYRDGRSLSLIKLT